MIEVIPLLIPIIALIIPIVAIWTRHQRQMAELQARDAAEHAARHASHTSELEERVRVLERIITDRGFDVASQIEALRDTPDTTTKIENLHRQKVN